MRVPGEHHLITTKAHDGGAAFASVHELGGRIETFPMSSADRLHGLLAEIDPDVVHLHAGALGPLLAQRSGLGRYPLLLTIYAWPGLPGRPPGSTPAGGDCAPATSCPARVLRHRVPCRRPSSVGPCELAPLGVLSPDPRVLERLAGCGVPVKRAALRRAGGRATRQPHAGAGPCPDGHLRRPVRDRCAASRTLIDAFPAVRARRPRRPTATAAPAPRAELPDDPAAVGRVRRGRRHRRRHRPDPRPARRAGRRPGGLLAVPRRLHDLPARHGRRRGHGGGPARSCPRRSPACARSCAPASTGSPCPRATRSRSAGRSSRCSRTPTRGTGTPPRAGRPSAG